MLNKNQRRYFEEETDEIGFHRPYYETNYFRHYYGHQPKTWRLPYPEAVDEAILMAIEQSIPQIIVQGDFQVVVNAINEKIGIPNDIINIVENIKCLLTQFSESRLEYCNRISNRDVDILVKMAQL